MNSFQTEYVILISKSKMAKWGALALIDNVIQSCSCSNHFFDPFFTVEHSRADYYFKKHLNKNSINIYSNENWVCDIDFDGIFSFHNYDENKHYFVQKDKFWCEFNKNPQPIIDKFFITNQTFTYSSK